ncbi:MAG: 16S rRNA (cytosine(1402)-N(4))-methyltransferase RsmH [Patescibacteria group bacterium]|jgi:16S rRNA (cytosine1402-N4)-methyltransferase
MPYFHVPVMLKETLEYLQPKSGQKFIDGTLGGASYTLALAAAVGEKGKVVSLDLDELALKNAALEIAKNKFNNVILVSGNFKNIKKIIADRFPPSTRFDGFVLDLGLSSAQLDDETRGFSFKGERPLDMSFGTENERSTEQIINQYPLLELTRIFSEYGEERWAYRLAQAVVAARRVKRFKTTSDLVSLIETVSPVRYHSKIHPATKIFQALRMETNEELSALSTVLPAALELLKPTGRLVVVSFHSGEDRIVKRFFKDSVSLQILTKKPIVPTAAEINMNPRARSAKLRVAALKINNF